MDPTLDALVDRVLALRARVGGGRPVLVGVVGEPGAGKSTLTTSLVAALRENGTTAVLVPMDGFHLANIALAALGRADRKGAIDTFDGAGYAALLARLREAGPHTVWAPTYDRSIEESVANAIPVPAGTDVVVTEGNYLLVDEPPWDGIRPLLDEAWFLAPDEDVHLADIVDSAVANAARSRASAQCDFVVDVAKDPPPIRGDRAQLVQVVDNLLSNAVRYGCTDPGAKVRLTASQRDGWVALTITDYGPGIARDHLPRVTERFYRADPARSRESGGTGLGLAIVKHIVERHRGTLEIKSILGEGTSVTVRLPAAA